MKCLIFYPLFGLILAILYLIFWLFVIIYMAANNLGKSDPYSMPNNKNIYNNGKILKNTIGKEYYLIEFNDIFYYLLILHILIGLWYCQFIIYHTYSVIAGGFADIYFSDWNNENNTLNTLNTDDTTKELLIKKSDNHDENININNNNNNQTPKSPILRSFGRTTKYHLGSIALGSLLIAILKTTQIILEYIEKRLLWGNEDNENDIGIVKFGNAIQKFILSCIHACLDFTESLINRINKFGFIMQAIIGSNLCKSAINATKLIFDDISLFMIINPVSTFLQYIGIGFIILISMLIMIIIIDINHSIQNMILPIIVCNVNFNYL